MYSSLLISRLDLVCFWFAYTILTDTHPKQNLRWELGLTNKLDILCAVGWSSNSHIRVDILSDGLSDPHNYSNSNNLAIADKIGILRWYGMKNFITSSVLENGRNKSQLPSGRENKQRHRSIKDQTKWHIQSNVEAQFLKISGEMSSESGSVLSQHHSKLKRFKRRLIIHKIWSQIRWHPWINHKRLLKKFCDVNIYLFFTFFVAKWFWLIWKIKKPKIGPDCRFWVKRISERSKIPFKKLGFMHTPWRLFNAYWRDLIFCISSISLRKSQDFSKKLIFLRKS
jgi:hypothetical protein